MTKTAVASDANPAQLGAPVRFEASVRVPDPGAGIPTGAVTFLNGKVVLGIANLDGAANATLTGIVLPVGSSNITAEYGSDANFRTSKSPTLIQRVEALPVVQFSGSSVKVVETVGTVALVVQRVGSAIGPVSVTYASANGSANAPDDFTAVSGTLNWAAGDSASKTIVFPIVADALPEPDETFTVTLNSPTGATLGSIPTVTVTIRKN